MLYTFKSYVESYKKELKPFDYKALGSILAKKSILGNFLYNMGNLFNIKDIYLLKKEIDFINKFSVSDENFMNFIESFYELFGYVEFATEFIDINKNIDLFLFSMTHENNSYYLKSYELSRISPLIFTEEDIYSMVAELHKFDYYKVHSLIALSQGFLSREEISETKDEMKNIIQQKLISIKSRKLIGFLMNLKDDKRERFIVLEKYLNAFH